ncbi:MAG: LysE family translocator [Cyclobacteriaceae bacterium]|nr:LysE family translocator [Cyclobacteriaceae bacterium HetDA_MAG_MS6]
MPPFLNGLLFGLIFIFSFGPAFFALIQTSIQNGLRAALLLAIGISMSDFGFVLLSLLGTSYLLEDPQISLWMGVFGTAVLFAYGMYTWFKSPGSQSRRSVESPQLDYIKYWLKGLVLNGLNPLVMIFWVSIISLVSVNYQYDISDQRIFFVGVLTTILTGDITKAVVAQKLKHLITPKTVLLFNRSLGVILILFGLRMLYFLFTNYA